MSGRKRRAAFDPNLLGDLGDVLPPIDVPRSIAQSESTGSSNDASEHISARVSVRTDIADRDRQNNVYSDRPKLDDSSTASGAPAQSLPGNSASPPSTAADEEVRTVDDGVSSRRRVDARRKGSRRDASSSSSRVAPPEVALPQDVYISLRSLTLNERSSDPSTARSYGQVVLDAVERHATELKAHWVGGASSPTTGLFRRSEPGRPTRRRHSEPRARVPLAGVINADAVVLDQLASDWGAGSRSALVEQALRLYLQVPATD